jgi:hypothetical protein
MLPPSSSTASPLTPIAAPKPIAPAKRWRWLLIAAGLVIFLLPVVLALEIVMLKRVGTRTPAGNEETEKVDATGQREEKSASEKSPGAGTTPATDDDAGAPPLADDPLLDVLGGLSGAHLYQSYLNIGFLHDGIEGELYTLQQARGWLASVDRTLEAVDQQMERIPAARLEPAERKRVARVRALAALLRTQVRELRLYWENDEEEHKQRYHKAREESWAGIQALVEGKE